MSARISEYSAAIDLVPIAPDDSNDLPTPARAIRCRPDGTAGTLRITTSGNEVRNTYIIAGQIIPIQTLRVHVTGTSATSLEALI